MLDELHLLTTEELERGQTIQHVERALRVRYNIDIDPRKVIVTRTPVASGHEIPGLHNLRTSEGLPARIRDLPPSPQDALGLTPPHEPTAAPAPEEHPLPPASDPAPGRIHFRGHEVEALGAQRIRILVALEWKGFVQMGEASGLDLPRSRLELLARATLHGIQAILQRVSGSPVPLPSHGLELDGVRLVEAFDRTFALVSVHGQQGSEINTLAGSVLVAESAERAVVLATLQATNRWVRGRM